MYIYVFNLYLLAMATYQVKDLNDFEKMEEIVQTAVMSKQVNKHMIFKKFKGFISQISFKINN